MAKTYAEHSYAGAQMLRPIVKKHIQDKALSDFGIFVDTTTDNAYEWTFVEVGDAYIYPFTGGFQGGASSKLTDKGVKLVEFKKEASYTRKKYQQRIQRKLLRTGATMEDISGTELARMEMELHMAGVRAGVYKSFWLGDTAKLHTKAGKYNPNDASTAYVIGDADKRYNNTDGIWKEITTRQSVDNVPRLALSGTGASTTLIDNGELTDDAAKEIFKQLYVNASDELKSLYDQGLANFYVTGNMILNYQETLEGDGTEAAHSKLINGVNRFLYRGLPMHNMLISGSIKADFANVMPFRACLTVPENLGMVLGLGSFAESVFWFNKDANENRQRTQWEMEHCFLDPKYLSVAY